MLPPVPFRSIEDPTEDVLAPMRGRAEKLHGRLHVDQGAAGTTLTWRVPITKEHTP
jgi:hypothetical protein